MKNGKKIFFWLFHLFEVWSWWVNWCKRDVLWVLFTPQTCRNFIFNILCKKRCFSLVFGKKSYFFSSVLEAERCRQDLQFWDFEKKINVWYLFRFILSTLRNFIVASLRTFFRLLEALYLCLQISRLLWETLLYGYLHKLRQIASLGGSHMSDISQISPQNIFLQNLTLFK